MLVPVLCVWLGPRTLKTGRTENLGAKSPDEIQEDLALDHAHHRPGGHALGVSDDVENALALPVRSGFSVLGRADYVAGQNRAS